MQRILTLLCALGLLAVLGEAQTSNPQIQYVTVAPSGACAATRINLLTPDGTIYTCQNGTWAAATGGGGGTCGALAGNVTGTCAATSVKGVRTGTIGALPGTCAVGDIYFATDAAAGGNIYQCTATNTWTAPAAATTTAYTQSFTTQTSVALTHNLNTLSVIVMCYDNGSPAQAIGWNTLQTTTANTATVTFTNAQTGKCTVLSGGGAGGGSGAAGGDLTGTYPSPNIKTSVGLTGAPTSPTGTIGDGSTQIANDAFVAGALQASSPDSTVQVSTTAVLPNSPTYSNGSSGVGATLTAGSNTTLAAIDGYTVLLNDRILVQNQASTFQNGCYTLTQAGSGSLPWILTRCVNYNTVTNINYTASTCTIQTGSTYASDTCFALTALISAVGTSAITYTQQAAGSNAGKPGGGVQFTGNTTSGDVVVVAPGAAGKNIKDYGFPPNKLSVNLPTPGATCTFSGGATVCVCTTTCTITVPVPAAGYQFCALNDDNVATVITLSAIGSSSRYENQNRTAFGTAGTGTLASAGAVKDQVCILGRDSTHYLFASGIGSWTAN